MVFPCIPLLPQLWFSKNQSSNFSSHLSWGFLFLYPFLKHYFTSDSLWYLFFLIIYPLVSQSIFPVNWVLQFYVPNYVLDVYPWIKHRYHNIIISKSELLTSGPGLILLFSLVMILNHPNQWNNNPPNIFLKSLMELTVTHYPFAFSLSS